MTTPNSNRFSRNLSMVAFAPLALGVLLMAMGQAMAGQTMAAPVGVDDNRVILRKIDRYPADARAARRTYDRIDAAALEVCGGGDHSNAQVNYAVHRSDCWRDAVRGALAQVSTPYLPVALGGKLPSRP